ncbi:MAG: serine/threonine protein kinase, partial [Myxococcales bacterium]|nr:serine/threonine protein kinase [Myxococcales bacterium]
MAGPGETFGPYRIVRRIGVGGMAETFLAVRFGPRNFEQRVCLKRVLPAFELDAKFVEQFVEEASIAASLRHSNIVGVIDVGEVGGTHFMALELVEGADLRSVLAKLPGERLRPDLVILLAVELAQALHHAHTQMRRGGPTGVVHRDISPSNVLISYAGEIKLADFGIAKAMRNSSASASGVVKGKIPYMAPEQARAEDLDARSDLFSLGVLLFEALSGRRPFDGATDVQTLTRVLSGERQFLREAAPDAPEELVETIERLLAFDREERWPSAEALLAAL